MNRFQILAVALVAAIFDLAPSAQAQTSYAVNNNGKTLIRFDLSSPGTFATIGDFSGAVANIDGLDFRPQDKLLYGYDKASNTIVTINPFNATTTTITMPAIGSNNRSLGLDFNPARDRLRLVNIARQNLRINVAGGGTTNDGTLTYAANDPNARTFPIINEVAYTNNDVDPNTGTQLYYLDTYNDSLVTTNDPNNGVLMTVAPLTDANGNKIDFDTFTGFDIYTVNGANSAFALLRVGGVSGLYGINLNNGATSFLGNLSGDLPVNNAYGLAITPVPEPGVVAFGVLASGSVIGLIARKRRGA